MERISKNRNEMLKIVLFIAISIVFSLGSTFFPLGKRLDFNDSSIYQYVGYIICKGKTPYIDVFDHKGIYFYFLNALGYAIDSKWGMWPLIIVAMLANIVAVYHLAKKFVSEKYALMTAILIGSSIGCSFWDGDTPDFFSLLFCILTFNALSEFFVRDKLSVRNIVLSGCFSAIAFWMKPNMIAGTLVVCACLIVGMLYQKNLNLAAISIATYTVSFAAASIPAIIWLWTRGALQAMIDDYFLFNLKYSGFSASTQTRLSAFSSFISYPVSMIAVLCLLIFLINRLRAKEKCNKTEKWLIVCGGISYTACLIHAALTGNAYTTYMMLLYPSIVFVIIGFTAYACRIYYNKKKEITVITSLIFVCILVLNARSEYQYCKYFWTAVPQEDEEIAYIKDISDIDDTIAVVSPYYSGMYIASNRDSATKYVYVQANHFVNMEKNPDEEAGFWNEYTEMLIEGRPRVIVYDNGFRGDDTRIKLILDTCLKAYKYVGSSAYKDFYVLPKSEDEKIPDFIPETEVDTSILTVTIPKEIMEKYQSGEITLDEAMNEIMNDYDEQIKDREIK